MTGKFASSKALMRRLRNQTPALCLSLDMSSITEKHAGAEETNDASPGEAWMYKSVLMSSSAIRETFDHPLSGCYPTAFC